jgi:hypothetical protein
MFNNDRDETPGAGTHNFVCMVSVVVIERFDRLVSEGKNI